MKRKLNTMQLLERLWQHDAPLRYVEAVDPRSGALGEVTGCAKISMREGAPTLPGRGAPHNDHRRVIMPHETEDITTTPDAPREDRDPPPLEIGLRFWCERRPGRTVEIEAGAPLGDDLQAYRHRAHGNEWSDGLAIPVSSIREWYERRTGNGTHEPPRIAQVFQQAKGKTCGKCGGRISRPGPCPVCDDSPFGRRP